MPGGRFLSDRNRRNAPQAAGQNLGVILPPSLEAVRRIHALFDIERPINGQSAERRARPPAQLSTPLVAELERWMRAQRAQAVAR